MGSGPSNPEPRVLRALATPLVGQFDPAFTRVMDDVGMLERRVFGTANVHSFPVSGASRAGIEAVLASLIEAGDRVVVANFGRFGDLLVDLARRYGADVESIDVAWGAAVDPTLVEQSLRRQPAAIVALVHADTSTGILQPLCDIARIARAAGALVVVDAVLSLGGCELRVDDWQLDAAIGGLQKCLGGPPGIAPLTYNERVDARLARRRTPPPTSYLDLVQLQAYWSPARVNHHTAPTSMVYALREALRLVDAEGLEARWARHQQAGDALAAGLRAMGLELFGDPRRKAPMIALVEVPEGVHEAAVRDQLREQHGIEIMAAFGALQGRVWRIGTMGYNARCDTVLTLLAALEHVLREHGCRVGSGTQSALDSYRRAAAA
ncbi:MAG: alanine--glyoxylate aminotransferase family protein [Chloroflexi bacterium]|nr:alanine--glyoxylate aminotransferase family protein [Chloroflexota bacterium]